MCLAIMAYVYAACTVRVTILVLVVNSDWFQILWSHDLNSNRLSSCALGMSKESVQCILSGITTSLLQWSSEYMKARVYCCGKLSMKVMSTFSNFLHKFQMNKECFNT